MINNMLFFGFCFFALFNGVGLVFSIHANETFAACAFAVLLGINCSVVALFVVGTALHTLKIDEAA